MATHHVRPRRACPAPRWTIDSIARRAKLEKRLWLKRTRPTYGSAFTRATVLARNPQTPLSWEGGNVLRFHSYTR
jgi:hypothetical protein